MGLEFELDNDQKEVVDFCLKAPYSIMAMEMGMGKTACAIAIKDSIPNPRCLVICPNSLIRNWQNEINKFLKGQIISRFKAAKDVYFPVDSDFVLVSYDIAIKSEVLFEWANIVIMDEGTAIKNMKAKRTEAIHKMIYENSIDRVHILTGTPIKNRVWEFYSLIATCNYNPKLRDPKFLDRFPSYVDFADHFSNRIEYEIFKGYRKVKVLKWQGIKNIPDLKEQLRGIYISKRSPLKPPIFKSIQLEAFDDKELLLAFERANFENSSVAPDAKAKAALAKVPLTVSYVKELQERGEIEGPVIVFTDHRESCHALAEALSNAPGITGEMSGNQRGVIGEKFQRGEIDVLCATYGSFSEGHNLTRSNFMALNDYPWVPGTLKQAMARINRKGQTRTCHVHGIFGSEQDEYIFKTIMDKQEVIDKIF